MKDRLASTDFQASGVKKKRKKKIKKQSHKIMLEFALEKLKPF